MLLTNLCPARRPYWAMLGWLLLAPCPGTSWAGSDLEPAFYSLRDWAPVRTWEYVALPTALAATLATYLAASPPSRWQGGILFDDWARNGLRLNSDAARSNASNVSTVLLLGCGITPFLLDAGLLTGVLHRRSDLAWQMIILDAEALTLTGLLTETTKRLTGRERPTGPGANDSFFSGHASSASAAATLLCLQHVELELLGDKVADATVCGAAAVTALSTGLLRVASDRHYLSDVIVGTAVGVGSAFLVYKLKVRPDRAERTALQITPLLLPNLLGLSFAGAF
jgi:membrane-associated phospholipid phosphatase